MTEHYDQAALDEQLARVLSWDADRQHMEYDPDSWGGPQSEAHEAAAFVLLANIARVLEDVRPDLVPFAWDVNEKLL